MSDNRYKLPDRSIIPLTLKNLDGLMEMEALIYPPVLTEDRTTLERLLKQNGLQLGLVMKDRLAGFLLTTDDYSEGANYTFIWDIAILPEFQKQGLGTHLLNHFLTEAHKRNLSIGLACRDTSLALFTNEERLRKCGYFLAECELESDGYFKEYGLHEDMHHIELKPV